MKQNSKGFTVIEMLAVLAIMGVLLAMSLTAYQNSRGQLALQRSANEIAQSIRRASEMAMSAKEIGGMIPTGGYGIYFDKNANPQQIIIFADCGTVPNHLYDASGLTCGTFDEKVEEINLEKNIKIQSIFYASSLNVVNIVFQAPSPKVFINNDSPPTGLATITLFYGDDITKTKTIQVNEVGLIDVY